MHVFMEKKWTITWYRKKYLNLEFHTSAADQAKLRNLATRL